MCGTLLLSERFSYQSDIGLEIICAVSNDLIGAKRAFLFLGLLRPFLAFAAFLVATQSPPKLIQLLSFLPKLVGVCTDLYIL